MTFKKSPNRYHLIHSDPRNSHSSITKCLINNKSVPFAILTSSEAKQHARYQLITKELEFTEVQLTLALERLHEFKKLGHQECNYQNTESVIIKSLIESAIISYMKCFTQASGRRVKLEEKKIFSSPLGQKFKNHHAIARDLRNNFIAHAGITNHEGSCMVATIDRPPYNNRKIVIAHSYFTFPDIHIIQKIHKMVQFVLKEHSSQQQEKLNTFCTKVKDNPSKHGAKNIFNTST